METEREEIGEEEEEYRCEGACACHCYTDTCHKTWLYFLAHMHPPHLPNLPLHTSSLSYHRERPTIAASLHIGTFRLVAAKWYSEHLIARQVFASRGLNSAVLTNATDAYHWKWEEYMVSLSSLCGGLVYDYLVGGITRDSYRIGFGIAQG